MMTEKYNNDSDTDSIFTDTDSDVDNIIRNNTILKRRQLSNKLLKNKNINIFQDIVKNETHKRPVCKLFYHMLELTNKGQLKVFQESSSSPIFFQQT